MDHSNIYEHLDKKYGYGRWHCDDILAVRSAPDCVLAFLEVARAPANRHGKTPPLFATYHGQRVRVVMASRFGDVGITENLDAQNGYGLRVYLPDLSDFSDKPGTNAKPPAETVIGLRAEARDLRTRAAILDKRADALAATQAG